MDSALAPSAPETISAKLRMILRGLMAACANWAVEPSPTPVLYNRISAILRRIERLLVRFRAGLLRPWAPRAAASGPRAAREPPILMPRKFGWLLAAGKHHAAYFHLQFQDVLNTPEMTALLAASPQARRILRPLCRALAVEVPGVSAPPRKPADGGRPKRPRKPRPKPEPFKIPLPRGVLSAARRAGFGKLC